ncbi:MAG: ATP-binding protein [Microcoleaceae cyanobacterium]
MSLPKSLQPLIQNVPVCRETDTIAAVWSIFRREQCHQIVVVDLQDHPQSCIELAQFLSFLFCPESDQGKIDLEFNFDFQIDWRQPLHEIVSLVSTPLQLLTTELDGPSFWLYLQDLQQQQLTQSQQSCMGLVDPSGRFLGLLDSMGLLNQLMTSNLPPFNPGASQSTIPTGYTLAHVLEQLPIPLMIQTHTGVVISQNQAWRSQIGQEHQVVQETAANIIQWPSARADFPPPEIDTHHPLPQWCHPGLQPETYVCICPVPPDQERVWQFARHALDNSNWNEFVTPFPACPIQARADLQLWLVIAQDVTEQHRVAQELTAKNADLIQLNRLKDEFLACVTHELKTPLTAVLGLSSLLKECTIGSLNDRQLRYAQLIHQSGHHLMLVVNDILDLTRMETGQLELVPGVVSIQSACQQAFEAALQLYHRTDRSAASASVVNAQQRFHLDVEAGLTTLIADEIRLRQMLLNLLSNALKFTPDERSIGLRVSHWEDWIAFTVWDEGIGIPADKQHLIFQKFQQLENPLTRQFEGTGLGLVLTQRLARLHGGDVSFISKENQGSEFTLLLPSRPPQKQPNADHQNWEQSPPLHSTPTRKPSRPALQVQSRLVLIVEAAPRFIHDLSDYLIHSGYRVVVARSGTEAVEKARRLQPRVIFLNPLLPLLSGWDVLTLLKTDAQTQQIPIIITATSGEKKRALLNRCDGFLSLPIQKSDWQKIQVNLETHFSAESPSEVAHQRLTILWLNPTDLGQPESPKANLTNNVPAQSTAEVLQHFSPCRVLEANDLDQAELIARIWHPDVTVLKMDSPEQLPEAELVDFLNALSGSAYLVDIPLVTLDLRVTEIANEIAKQTEQLSVFPCLIGSQMDQSMATAGDRSNAISQELQFSLLQAIQVAAGMTWKPNILVVDLLSLADLGDLEQVRNDALKSPYPQGPVCTLQTSEIGSDLLEHQDNNLTGTVSCVIDPKSVVCQDGDPTSKIDRALVQYFQTAGFRGSMSHSWAEVLQQIRCQSVDLLLICIRDFMSRTLIDVLASVEMLSNKPAIIIFDQSNFKIGSNHYLDDHLNDHSKRPNKSGSQRISAATSVQFSEDLQAKIEKLQIKILPCHMSMAELLEQIKQSLEVQF